MNTKVDANTQPAPVGELFARVYLDRGAPVQDSPFFRNRLDAFLQTNHYKDYADLSTYLRQESGIVVSSTYLDTYKSVFYNFTEFFSATRIDLVLNAITLIWRFIARKYPEWVKSGGALVCTHPKADAWCAFVARALREENIAYTVDEKCGVHFLIDEEFERNRVSALKCLESPRYAGVRAAFEAAHGYLDAQPIDTKASVRSAFEAIEILARLIDAESKNLNKWMVENKLKPRAVAYAVDSIEATVIEKIFDGLAQFIDGLHNYRHGQAVQQPVAPSLATAVYALSVVAAAIRWLASLDLASQAAAGVPR